MNKLIMTAKEIEMLFPFNEVNLLPENTEKLIGVDALLYGGSDTFESYVNANCNWLRGEFVVTVMFIHDCGVVAHVSEIC